MRSVIAIGNLKGGVGKTTIAVNLACQLAATRRVWLIDADPQESAFDWCSTGALPITAEALPLEDGGDPRAWQAQIEAADADLVVIDLPPNLGPATEAAMRCADLFVVPCTPSVLDHRATARLLARMREIRLGRSGVWPFCVLVPSRVDRRVAVGQDAERDMARLGELVGPPIGQRAAFINAASQGSWVGAAAPASIAATEIATLAGMVDRLAKPAVRMFG